ncbi:5-oxoprolinase subunit B family protein [Parasphingorhabdus sp.]|uniref:5-oxoprolinase subunit B family protein n=1 Tax=Parasphingorhabdus sp. TaxID=2709688 RepID=UPI003A926094
MTDLRTAIHICDDWIDIQLPNQETVIAAQMAFSANHHWTEIVPALGSIAVQFDPAVISPDEAANIVRDQLDHATSTSDASQSTINIPVCYDRKLAPDLKHVADRLGIAPETLPSWHTARAQSVAMLGFMPGFAYLDSEEECPAIGRLPSPRQLVKAGSIGIIGRQSCIYSFDSPGGWPIIGRTPLRLFDPAKEQPALLSPGQTVRFESISRAEFENWTRAKDQ